MEQFYILDFKGLTKVSGTRINDKYAYTKSPNGVYNVTHIPTGCCVQNGGYVRLKDAKADAKQKIKIAEKYLFDNPDLEAIMEVRFQYCLNHDLKLPERINRSNMRRVSAISIIDRLEIKNPEFLINLYRAFDLKHIDDNFKSYYGNEYIRKWISIEERFNSRGIQICPDGKNWTPKGLAVNLKQIEEYLELKYELPFN